MLAVRLRWTTSRLLISVLQEKCLIDQPPIPWLSSLGISTKVSIRLLLSSCNYYLAMSDFSFIMDSLYDFRLDWRICLYVFDVRIIIILSEIVCLNMVWIVYRSNFSSNYNMCSKNIQFWMNFPGNIYWILLIKFLDSKLLLNLLTVRQVIDKHGLEDVIINWINTVCVHNTKICGNITLTINIYSNFLVIQINNSINVNVGLLEGAICIQNIQPINY
jgi:hypothetical protein